MRPVIRTKPSSSISPTSPVLNHPSASSASAVAVVVAEVADEDLAAPELQLAVVGDANAGPGDRLADGADPLLVGEVDGECGRGLGEAVALQHREPDAAEEVGEPLAERCTTRDGVLRAAAERGAQLGVDEPVEQAMTGAEQRAGATPVLGLAVGDGGPDRRVEDLAAAVGDGALARGVEDLLEDARHGEDEGRLEGGEVGDQVLDVGGVPEPDPALDAADLDDPREDVRQREEQQGARVVELEQLLEHAGGDAELEHEVAVGQHAALGPAGRAGRVDQRRDRLRGHRCATCLEVVVADGARRPARSAQPFEPAVVDAHDLLQLGQLCADAVDPGAVLGGLGDRPARRRSRTGSSRSAPATRSRRSAPSPRRRTRSA